MEASAVLGLAFVGAAVNTHKDSMPSLGFCTWQEEPDASVGAGIWMVRPLGCKACDSCPSDPNACVVIAMEECAGWKP